MKIQWKALCQKGQENLIHSEDWPISGIGKKKSKHFKSSPFKAADLQYSWAPY